MKRGRTERETCDLNGWGPGTRLVGDEGYGPTVLRITAVGERMLLALGEDSSGRGLIEHSWTLGSREWTLAPPVSERNEWTLGSREWTLAPPVSERNEWMRPPSGYRDDT